MATHQDYWQKPSNGEDAREWLAKLQIGDELLHPKPGLEYNRCDPSGKGFEVVSIKSIKPDRDSVIIGYPNMEDNWDRELPLKYAFAVRPIDSIQKSLKSAQDTVTEGHTEEDENLSQTSSDSSIVAPEHTVPFPQNNIKNDKDKISFTFNKQQKNHKNHKKKALSTFRGNNNAFITDPPESTPPTADRSLFNKLHHIREQHTKSPKLLKTYADSRGSKNRRNRAIKASSEKVLGHLKKEKQMLKHREKERKRREREKEEEEEEEKQEIVHKHYPPFMRGRGRYPPDLNEGNGNGNRYTDNDGPMTRNRYRQQREKQYISSRVAPDCLKTRTTLKQPIGLQNMGNTCFMNSTLQSLLHTEQLRHFFLNNDENKWFTEQLNRDNPIGYGGKIAVSFSDLVLKQCSESQTDERYYASAVRPNVIHYNLTGTLRQFADYRQHDAQEFMTNFLDALHEDLNRIKEKRYMEIPDFDKKDEKSEERKRGFLHKRWHEIYLKRNNSVCTDLFAGLLKSTVTCPVCDFTAITFDPFMHLLVPLKAPKNMLRSVSGGSGSGSAKERCNGYNGYKRERNGHRNRNKRKFIASDEDDDDVMDDMDRCKQLMLYLFPKGTEVASWRVNIAVTRAIVDNNDWTQLHATIYEYLIANYCAEMDKDQREEIAIHRAQMIESPEFNDDEHFLYYGLNDVGKVKQCHDDNMHIPKRISGANIVEFPIFKLVELHQEDKLLDFASICTSNYNTKISDYIAGTGHKRLCVQEIPSHWTDPQKMNIEDGQKIKCHIVFKKPSYDDDKSMDDDHDMDKGERRDVGVEMESAYEPFNYPRIIFDKGLTAKLDEANKQHYLYKRAKELVQSIAGNGITDDAIKHEIEIRFCRTMDKYTLDKTDKWRKVMFNESTNNSNSNSSECKPIRSLVIVFSFSMHQMYTEHQRIKEEKEKNAHAHNIHNQNNARKRSFQAMNGGNSCYNNDPLDTIGLLPRKRQRTGGCHSNGYTDRRGRDGDNDVIVPGAHDARDTSLPFEFQPTETKAQTIKECFGIFLSREQLGKDNKWYCKMCQDHVQGRKKLDLWWLPSHLIIAIKRFDNHGLRKYSDYVKYPVNGLDLTHIIRGRDTLDIYHNEHDVANNVKSLNDKHKKEKFVYDLYAVINHSGSLNFGHYTATIKFGDRWYDISDSSVSSCSNPISSQAYILCYKKKEQE